MTSADTHTRFVSTLEEKWKSKAKIELNEDDNELEGIVQTFREWIIQQNWLKSPTDTGFLLRFLRVRKFSQLCARDTLEHYWAARSKHKEWYKPGLSSSDPNIIDIIKSGFYLFLPGEDRFGRRVIIERPGALNVASIVKKYGTADVIFQAVMCIWDVLNMDERIQVNGFVLLHDGSKSNMDTASAYNISTMKTCMHIFQKSYPTRIKGIHVYHLPVMFEALMKFCKTIFSDKIAGRLTVHGKSLVPVYEHIDQYVLPKEYLPDDFTGPSTGTIADVVDYMVKELQKPDVVEHISDLNSGKYGIDFKLRKTTEIPAESYRKLNVD